MRFEPLHFAMATALVIGAATASFGQDGAEGRKLYETYCVACHGDKGKGNGPAAQSLPAKPADHTNGAVMNLLSDQFLYAIIAKGGSAVGKSSFMPSWSGALNDKQIKDLTAHVRSLADPPYKANATGKSGAK